MSKTYGNFAFWVNYLFKYAWPVNKDMLKNVSLAILAAFLTTYTLVHAYTCPSPGIFSEFVIRLHTKVFILNKIIITSVIIGEMLAQNVRLNEWVRHRRRWTDVKTVRLTVRRRQRQGGVTRSQLSDRGEKERWIALQLRKIPNLTGM